jgi:hypothetical protein
VVDAATLFAQTRSQDLPRQISDEEAVSPPPPRGVNTSVTATICIMRGGCAIHKEAVGRTPDSADLLGEPMLSPTYDFGIVTPYGATRHVDTGQTTLPVIASVTSSRKDYNITFLGTENVGSDAAYHLHFEPLGDPHRYRLRDLWINPTTHLPERAIVGGNFTLAPMTDVPWTIVFEATAKAWYVSRETAMSTLYLAHKHVVRNAAIAFEQIQPFDGIDGPILQPDVTPTTLAEP